MSRVLVLGGGLAGAVVANELAASGRKTLIVEKSSSLGGKVRDYGCKATEKCNNCGVCLTKDLWDSVENSDLIDIRLCTTVSDLTGEKGNYSAALKKSDGTEYVSGISDVVVATGFNDPKSYKSDGFIEISGTAGSGDGSVCQGSDLEALTKERDDTGFFSKAPESVAFIQCFGSRDKKENAMYCSRVCCAYSTRIAKMVKQLYPDCRITFFYMEMQQVKSGGYFDELKELGIEFIKCRPVKIQSGTPACVVFDNPVTGTREKLAFDVIVLSDGIRPALDNARIAEICGIGQGEDGFLKYVKNADDANDTGIYIAGCAAGPYKIEEVYAEAVAVAKRILFS